jgi:acyl-CoA synthetase (AMP-forming)/AMP-acid ligase II
MLREQAYAYADAAAAALSTAGVDASTPLAALGRCSFEGARWVSLHVHGHYVLHDVALGGCALLHPFAIDAPHANICPHAVHSLVNRFNVSTIVAPPTVWYRLATSLPSGALRAIALPMCVGATPPELALLRDTEQLLRPASPPSSLFAADGLVAVSSSAEGIPLAVCTAAAAHDPTIIARVAHGDGACAGTPLASARLRIDRGSGSGADVGEIVIVGPELDEASSGQGPSRTSAAGAGGDMRTGESGSLDAAGRLWMHGRLADFVRTASSGMVPPLDVESVVMGSGLLRWCALVGAPLAVSASATVLIVNLAGSHPHDRTPLKWGPELRITLRETLLRSRFAALAGTVRILQHAATCPTEKTFGWSIDREALRVWAVQTLRGIGVEQLRLDDKLDSVERLKRRKAG